MGGKRLCTDEEINFILSCKGTFKDIASKCHLRWPERDISEVNIRSVRSTYLVDNQGNVTSRSIHNRLMLQELSKTPELSAAKMKATREAEQREAAVQQAEQRDFELFQSSAKVSSASGINKWQSNVAPPMAAISEVMNQARKQGLIEPLNSTDTSSSIQSKDCSDQDVSTLARTLSQPKNTEAMSVTSSTRMDIVLPVAMTTAQNRLNDAPTSLTSQQIMAPIQTAIPFQSSTLFYDDAGSEITVF